MMHSQEEWKEKQAYLDLLERASPPQFDDDKRFKMAMRGSETFYIPVGTRTGREAQAAIFATAPAKLLSGSRVSAGAYRRMSMTPSPRRSTLRKLSPQRSHSSESLLRSLAQTPPPPSLGADAPVGREPIKHGTPAVIKAQLGSGRRHTIREGKLRRLSSLKAEAAEEEEQEQQVGFVQEYVAEQLVRSAATPRLPSFVKPKASPASGSGLPPTVRSYGVCDEPVAPSLTLSKPRLFFVARPNAVAVAAVDVHNASTIAVRIIARPDANASLPAALGSPRGRPGASPFVLTATAAADDGAGRWVLPGASTTLTFCFRAAVGTFVERWTIDTYQRLGWPPLALDLTGRVEADDTASAARRAIEDRIGVHERWNLAQDILLRSIIHPIVDRGA